jgi:hypothetical protein
MGLRSASSPAIAQMQSDADRFGTVQADIGKQMVV